MTVGLARNGAASHLVPEYITFEGPFVRGTKGILVHSIHLRSARGTVQESVDFTEVVVLRVIAYVGPVEIH
jgi:hypothetical protein